LTQTLKAGGSAVGIIEGIAETTQNLVQGFSGWLSDKWQKRKGIAVFGYILAALSKPFIGFATGWSLVLGARFVERFGAGTRSAPRDALIAASTDEQNRGKAFGLEGVGDNLGAALISYPSGRLSDKLGRKNILILAFVIFLITYAGFAFTSNLWLTAADKGKRYRMVRCDRRFDRISSQYRGRTIMGQSESFSRFYLWGHFCIDRNYFFHKADTRQGGHRSRSIK
jgi:MFS family permease